MAKAASTPALVRPADLAAVRQLLKEWTLDTYLRSKPPSTVVTLSDDMTIGQVDDFGPIRHDNPTSNPYIHRMACINPHQPVSQRLQGCSVSMWRPECEVKRQGSQLHLQHVVYVSALNACRHNCIFACVMPAFG